MKQTRPKFKLCSLIALSTLISMIHILLSFNELCNRHDFKVNNHIINNKLFFALLIYRKKRCTSYFAFVETYRSNQNWMILNFFSSLHISLFFYLFRFEIALPQNEEELLIPFRLPISHPDVSIPNCEFVLISYN